MRAAASDQRYRLARARAKAARSALRQTDIWKNYRGVIFRPPYTEGVIPRVLDQLGKPQRIYVFGSEEYYKNQTRVLANKVRVVGGVIEQFCTKAPCTKKNTWQSKMILLAVDVK